MIVDGRSLSGGDFFLGVARTGAADDRNRAEQEAELRQGSLHTDRRCQQRSDSLGHDGPGNRTMNLREATTSWPALTRVRAGHGKTVGTAVGVSTRRSVRVSGSFPAELQ